MPASTCLTSSCSCGVLLLFNSAVQMQMSKRSRSTRFYIALLLLLKGGAFFYHLSLATAALSERFGPPFFRQRSPECPARLDPIITCFFVTLFFPLSVGTRKRKEGEARRDCQFVSSVHVHGGHDKAAPSLGLTISDRRLSL